MTGDDDEIPFARLDEQTAINEEDDSIDMDVDIRTIDELGVNSDEAKVGCSAILDLPKCTWLIFSNEMCERFAYYGMRSILTLYLTQQLLLSDNTAVTVYSAFIMLCYLTPILGAIVADSFWGKHRTIIVFSLIYALGLMLTSASSVRKWFSLDETKVFAFISLTLIAIGCGGIKPNVSAFGADQIQTNKAKVKTLFFSVFYISINIGSVISMLLTPILHERVHCFGQDQCYPLAFGVPALLFLVATACFLLGTPLYRNVGAPSDHEGSMIVQACGSVVSALRNRIRDGNTQPKFLYHASDEYDRGLLDELTQLGKLFVVLSPTAIFFMGFDQQGSTWTLQAEKMDGRFGFITLYPDQMQFCNSFLILILVPFTNFIIFPLLRRCALLTTDLQKMGMGMTLASVAFVMATLLQLKIDSTLPFKELVADDASVWTVNTIPCNLTVRFFEDGKLKQASEHYEQSLTRFTYDYKHEVYFEVTPEAICQGMLAPNDTINITVKQSEAGKASYLYLYLQNRVLRYAQQSNSFEISPTESDCYLSFFSAAHKSTFHIGTHSYVTNSSHILPDITAESGNGLEVKASVANKASTNDSEKMFDAKYGGVYLFTLTEGFEGINLEHEPKNYSLNIYTIEDADMVKMYWQVPQYIVITLAEVFVLVTGYNFAYTQSGTGVKSCAQAIFLLGDSFGNLFNIIFFQSIMAYLSTMWQFAVNALVIAFAAVLFMILTLFYTPVEPVH